jgi:hypothetical protein
VSTEQIRAEFNEMLEGIPNTWTPHETLDFAKASFSGIVTKLDRKTKIETTTLGEQLKKDLTYAHRKLEMHDQNPQLYSEESKVRLLRSITQIENEVEEFTNKQGEHLARITQTKWYHEGEKSNKYFLNIAKFRQLQKQISSITDLDGNKITSQAGIINYITEFYKDLYSKEEHEVDKVSSDKVEEFFKNCPKLSVNDKEFMDSPITLEELTAALKSCKNSTPGPDGISYDFYKKFWPQWGNIILESWNYSLKVGKLPESNLTSAITLLPKEGKNLELIANWRPISLTNCDLKIITKAYAIRLAAVADTIIHPNQSAYIPGRSVMDNLRAIKELARNGISESGKNLLISLDAKKAFDSVSHSYIKLALSKYGFGEGFIGVFDTLYHKLKAKILINGWQSAVIEILKGVKQGDALSCILFIICMDPLIRNINSNDIIKKIKHSKLPDETHTNAFGHADDISNLCNDDPVSIQEIFTEYEKLSKLSNLTLNADKTEIVQFLNNKNTNTNQIARSDYPIHLPALRVQIRSALRAHINMKFPLGNTSNSTDPETANAVFTQHTLTRLMQLNHYNLSRFVVLTSLMTFN